jgi:hypothetical protein
MYPPQERRTRETLHMYPLPQEPRAKTRFHREEPFGSKTSP